MHARILIVQRNTDLFFIFPFLNKKKSDNNRNDFNEVLPLSNLKSKIGRNFTIGVNPHPSL